MVERKPGSNNIPESRSQFTRPDLQINNDIVSTPSSRLSRVREQVDRRKLAIGTTAAVVSTPYIVGLAEGLEPREALVYGTLQWATGGGDENAAVKETTQEILTGGIQNVAELGLIGGVVAYIYDSANRTEKRRKAIQEGTAKIKPEGEQIVVLGGSGSHVIDALASSSVKDNFIPVLESAERAHEELLFQYTDKIKKGKPVYLNLGVNGHGNERTRLSYLETHAWDLLKLGKDNLLQAPNGHRYLLVVGCGEAADEELSLDPNNVDVSHDDLRSAVLRLKTLLKPDDLVEQRDVIDMYIGNADIPRKSAENRLLISDRELARKTGVDIYVDTWALVLRELANKIAEGEVKEVSLATTNDEYEKRFQERFAGHMVRFPGCEELQLTHIEKAGEEAAWIVYEGPSDETFQTAKRLRKLYPERRIIALLSNDKVANYIQIAGVENVEFICASTILAETTIGVKNLIKDGYTPAQIQELLDEYAPPVPPLEEPSV